MLRPEIGEPPRLGAQHVELLAARQIRAIRQHELDVGSRLCHRNLALPTRQRMTRRRDREHPDAADRLLVEIVHRPRHGSTGADRAGPVEDEPGDRSQSLDIKPEIDGRKGGPKCNQSRNEPRSREHHIDRHGEFGFEPGQEARGLGAQPIDAKRHLSGFGQQGLSGLGQRGFATAAVEEPEPTELSLEIGDRVADDRLSAVEAASRSRKAALVNHGEKHAELVERRRTESGHDVVREQAFGTACGFARMLKAFQTEDCYAGPRSSSWRGSAITLAGGLRAVDARDRLWLTMSGERS